MFNYLKAAPIDPILGLAELYNADKRKDKINLSVALYKDEHSVTPILDSVKKAEQLLIEQEESKAYLPIEGLMSYNLATQSLILGSPSSEMNFSRVKTIQTPGSTGALCILADLLKKQLGMSRIWVSDPTWPNHFNIFRNAGLGVKTYRYYDDKNHALDMEGLLSDLGEVKEDEAVVFHGCCHNPTGIDPTFEQWQQICEVARQGRWLPIFDLAYQGFGDNLEQDVQGIRLFSQQLPEVLIANSYSKNFGLYNERVGALTIVAEDETHTDTVLSQLKHIARANYSTPPSHGAQIVATILNTPELREEWESELTTMRERICRMRQLFVNTLQNKGANQRFNFIAQQKGMFSFSGLKEEEMVQLRDDYAIYCLESGRINLAGINLDNMSQLCEAIISVTTTKA